jgi:protein O-mannosyl-transferase
MKAAKQRAAAPASRPRHWVALAAIFVLTLLAYSNSFQSGFVLDNKPLILGDARVHAATAENVGRLFEHSYWWPTGEAGIHRPFTKLSFLFNYAILGNRDQPAGYHAVNFLLHFANVLLVYVFGLRLLRDYRLAAALAGLWAVHPALTESVTNIVGRADLLAGMAVVGGLLLYLGSAQSTGWRRLIWLAALFTAALVGMLSKESAAVLVGVVALYEWTWWRERRNAKALVMGCAVIGLAFLAMWTHRTAVLGAAGHSDFPFTDNPLVSADFWTGRLTAVDVMARGVALIAWPAQLSSDYSYNQIPLVTGTPRDGLSCLAMAVVAAGVAIAFRRNRTAFFFACFAFLTYLPTSNLLFPIGTIMAERFLYLPSIGVIGCVILAGHALARRYGALRWAPLRSLL